MFTLLRASKFAPPRFVCVLLTVTAPAKVAAPVVASILNAGVVNVLPPIAVDGVISNVFAAKSLIDNCQLYSKFDPNILKYAAFAAKALPRVSVGVVPVLSVVAAAVVSPPAKVAAPVEASRIASVEPFVRKIRFKQLS